MRHTGVAALRRTLAMPQQVLSVRFLVNHAHHNTPPPPYVIPPDKALATAERPVNSRLADHEKQAPGKVEVFHRGSQRRSQGQGLEMYYTAHIANEDVVMSLVYVMPRRVLNLTLRAAAVALFKGIHAHFRPGIS
jgi:hypothetical protein